MEILKTNCLGCNINSVLFSPKPFSPSDGLDISGAIGSNASEVNGVYYAIPEFCSRSCFYIKAGDPKMCIHFWKQTSRWHITDVQYKTQNNGVAYAFFSPENLCDVWVCSSNGEFVPRKNVLIRNLDKSPRRNVLATLPSGSDSSTVTAGCDDGFVHIFDAATGTEILKTTQHGNKVTSASVSFDGKRLVTGCCDGFARVFDFTIDKRLCKHSHALHTVPKRVPG